MRNKTVLEDLDAKISLILERYNWIKKENVSIKEENAQLKRELESLTLLLKEKTETITRLKEDDELKDLELEDIAYRISEAMGLVPELEELEAEVA